MANFGPALLKAGIDYKGMGYEKLNEFVSQSGVFEVYSDTSCKVPVKYIKEKKTERIFLKSIERNVRKQHIRILMR